MGKFFQKGEVCAEYTDPKTKMKAKRDVICRLFFADKREKTPNANFFDFRRKRKWIRKNFKNMRNFLCAAV